MNALVNMADETIKEDLPISKYAHESGKYDGKIEGYAVASSEHKKKLLKHADEFSLQKNNYE